ncbi:hypothetical protein HPB50_017531 [Hyalomma asiaticum]|uniref:Uncharacterized protein n=1 Tax=Hyalomma asiaticum TaxID=266040 RepID=A0ACB7RX33_HYAAI|nr:hypothetical protein HPB50_017531 [Hyalomma asiaticum]
MKLSVLFTGLLLSSYVAMGTPPSLLNLLTHLPPLSLTSLLPFPLALPLAMLGPLPWVLPLVVGLKGASLLGLGIATGGVAGFGLAGLGAVGVKLMPLCCQFLVSTASFFLHPKVALANSVALKAATLGAAAAKAKVTSAAASAAAKAGVKAIVGGAKSKIATPVVAPVSPVVAAPPVPLSPVVPAGKLNLGFSFFLSTEKCKELLDVNMAITNVKVIKQAPPTITSHPVPVDPWKLTAIWPAGWDHSFTYGYPLYGYGLTRSAIDLGRKVRTRYACNPECSASRRLLRLRRRSGDESQATAATPSGRWRRDAPAPNAALDGAGDMSPQMLKNVFSYISSYDSERCVLRVICEVAAEPSLAGPDGKSVADFMTSLSKEDSAAPWMPYRDAAVAGQASADRQQCLKHYPTCTKSTESLVEIARFRIAHASQAASAGAPKV